jgi:hypothetical protein
VVGLQAVPVHHAFLTASRTLWQSSAVLWRLSLESAQGCPTAPKVFVDDVIIHSKTMEEHIQHVAAVLDALHAVRSAPHPAKSVFGTDRVEYLGHMVTPVGLEPMASKDCCHVSAASSQEQGSSYAAPSACCNYYRCYIPKASVIAQPLNRLLRKDVTFEWGPEQPRGL